MTTEDDFQKALNADPGDWQTRLVFADWLQERADSRADGYRALATGQFYPLRITDGSGAWTAGADDNPNHRNHPRYGRAMVARDWYSLVAPPPEPVNG